MSHRPLPRSLALLVLLAPAQALAASLNAAPTHGRIAGWYALAAVQVLGLVGLLYFVGRALGSTPEAYRGKALALAAVTLLLGVGTVVMADTEPVVQRRFLEQDTVDFIELLGYAEAALGIAAGLLAFYAKQLLEAFSGPTVPAQVDDLPPAVEPARPSLRRRRQ